jgi:hypothetical protein
VDERTGVGDGTVDMGFSREVQDMVDLVTFNDPANAVRIPQIDFLEAIPGIFRHWRQILQVSRVGQTIQVHYPPHPGLTHHMPDQVRTDESSATSNQQVHWRISGRRMAGIPTRGQRHICTGQCIREYS